MAEVTPERLAEIEARAAAATPGPWEATGISPAGGTHRMDLRIGGRITRWRSGEYFFHTQEPPDDSDNDGEHPQPCCDCGPGKVRYDQEEADIRFTAAARTDVPDLCAALREARREQHEARAVLTQIVHLCGYESIPPVLVAVRDVALVEEHARQTGEALREAREVLALIQARASDSLREFAQRGISPSGAREALEAVQAMALRALVSPENGDSTESEGTR